MNFNVFNSLILAGVIQGIIFILVVLFSKKFKSTANYFLVGLITCCVYNNLQYYLSDSGILHPAIMFATVYLPVASLTPVMIYYYVSKYLYPSREFNKTEKLFLAPFIFFTLSIIPYKIGELINYENDAFYIFYTKYSNFHELFSIIFTLVMTGISYKKIVNYENEKDSYNSKEIRQDLKWLKYTLIIFFALAAIWLITMIQMLVYNNLAQSFYLLWIGISFLIYWLGHVGVYKYGVAEERKKIRSYNQERKTTITETISENAHLKELEKILVKKEQYLNPSINLETLAKKIDISKSHLSRIINSELGLSFTDYLNSLRVEKAKEFIENSHFSHYTLSAIGLEAGFNSKSTFYKAFKKNTGFTPSEYKKRIKTVVLDK